MYCRVPLTIMVYLCDACVKLKALYTTDTQPNLLMHVYAKNLKQE